MASVETALLFATSAMLPSASALALSEISLIVIGLPTMISHSSLTGTSFSFSSTFSLILFRRASFIFLYTGASIDIILLFGAFKTSVSPLRAALSEVSSITIPSLSLRVSTSFLFTASLSLISTFPRPAELTFPISTPL